MTMWNDYEKIARRLDRIASAFERIANALETANIIEADRKTENSSEKPNNCDTCKWGEWYRKGYDITMMDDECGGCCSWKSKWTPKTEPTISKMEQVDKDINVRSKTEPQTDCSWK